MICYFPQSNLGSTNSCLLRFKNENFYVRYRGGKEVRWERGEITIKQIWVQIPIMPLNLCVFSKDLFKGLIQMSLDLLAYKLKILIFIF